MSKENVEVVVDEKIQGVLKLYKPLTIDGKEVTEIPYDFGSLTPMVYRKIIKDASKEGAIAVPELSQTVQDHVFARAAYIPPAVINTQFHMIDYLAACRAARDFLLYTTDEQEE